MGGGTPPSPRPCGVSLPVGSEGSRGGMGLGKGNGESTTANTMTSRHTNVTKTNQCPAFFLYRTGETRMHPHG